MNNLKQLVCPISNEHITERVTRINALLAILLVLAGFVLNSPLFIVFLMADFFIRAFTKLKYSPLSYISNQLVNAFQLNKKVTDKAPKVFAARLGLLMTLTITVLLLTGLNIAAFAVAGVLVFFASLEFALGLCMGCIIYTYLVLPFYK
jgi:small-conductance mechanosensitive channel